MELGLTFPLQRFLRVKTPAYGIGTAGRLLLTGGSAVCGGGAAHPGRGRGQGIDNRLAQAVLP